MRGRGRRLRGRIREVHPLERPDLGDRPYRCRSIRLPGIRSRWAARPELSERGDHVDVLTFHEGRDVDYPHVSIYRIPAWPFLRNIRPGFSWKKLVCDGLMCAKMFILLSKKRYHLIHAVEESAFMALLVKKILKIPYVYDMDSSLAQQMIERTLCFIGFHSLSRSVSIIAASCISRAYSLTSGLVWYTLSSSA